MATKTSSGSGLWSEVMGSPANGDTCIIAEGHHVTFDADISAFTNGLALLTINSGAILDFKASAVTYLKMNGNIDVNGAFYIGERATVSSFSATENRVNVYQVSRTVKTYSVEETLGNGYLAAWNEVMEAAIDTENARLRGLGEAEMMADEVIEFIETTRASLTSSDYLDYVEENPGSFYQDIANNLLYIHTSDSTNPSGKTITGIEPINRPAAGSENRCTIMFNSTGVFTNTAGGSPVFQAYGWHPEREWTQLSANVNISATELSALNHSLDIQQGDKISIGSGNENGMPAETGKGVYTVSSYNPETKIITLSSGLVKERLKDDYVCIASRSIKISRSSGTNALMTITINDIVLEGVYADTYIVQNTADLTAFSSNITAKHCISRNKALFSNIKNSIISNSIRIGGASSVLVNGNSNDINDCICISGVQIASGNLNRLNRCIQENTITTSGGIIKNSKFINFQYIAYIYESIFINCEFSGQDNDTIVYNFINTSGVINCVFKDNLTGYLKFFTGKLLKCIFEGESEVNAYNFFGRLPHQIIESFDHNQIIGNYKAWMLGGTIETLFTDEEVQPGHLIYKPVSEDYPVFRDYLVFFQANRITTYYVHAEKDFTGGTVQTEIIDPSNDPLIDSNATAFDTALLEDVEDEQKTMRVAYKPDIGKQLILRVSVINGSGEVNVEKPLTFEKFRRKELL